MVIHGIDSILRIDIGSNQIVDDFTRVELAAWTSLTFHQAIRVFKPRAIISVEVMDDLRNICTGIGPCSYDLASK